MATSQEKALRVRWFFKTKLEAQVQRRFHTYFGSKTPIRCCIRSWQNIYIYIYIYIGKREGSWAGKKNSATHELVKPFSGTLLDSTIPYVTKIDFFLWAQVKRKVYAAKVTGAEGLKTRIRDVMTAVGRGMLTARRKNCNLDWKFSA
jgi:hypothetical protein